MRPRMGVLGEKSKAGTLALGVMAGRGGMPALGRNTAEAHHARRKTCTVLLRIPIAHHSGSITLNNKSSCVPVRHAPYESCAVSWLIST